MPKRLTHLTLLVPDKAHYSQYPSGPSRIPLTLGFAWRQRPPCKRDSDPSGLKAARGGNHVANVPA